MVSSVNVITEWEQCKMRSFIFLIFSPSAFCSPSYDDDLSTRPKVKKKKRKSFGKRKRKRFVPELACSRMCCKFSRNLLYYLSMCLRSPSHSLSPLRKKKKKRKKSSKKSKRHRYFVNRMKIFRILFHTYFHVTHIVIFSFPDILPRSWSIGTCWVNRISSTAARWILRLKTKPPESSWHLCWSSYSHDSVLSHFTSSSSSKRKRKHEHKKKKRSVGFFLFVASESCSFKNLDLNQIIRVPSGG